MISSSIGKGRWLYRGALVGLGGVLLGLLVLAGATHAAPSQQRPVPPSAPATSLEALLPPLSPPAPTPDPDLKPGFPVQSLAVAGSWQGGPVINAVVGNIDADPQLEIIVTGLTYGPIYAWNADGTLVPGWGTPNDFPGQAFIGLGELAPTLPGLEVLAGYFGYNTRGALTAYSGAGQPLPGWPLYPPGAMDRPPALADVDHDGVDEIFMSHSAQLYGYRASGVVLPGWPAGSGFDPYWGTPAIGDLDGDGDTDFVVATEPDTRGVLVYAFHTDLSSIAGFPVLFPNYGMAETFPVLGDVDGDGQTEVVVIAREEGSPRHARVYVVDRHGQIERSMVPVTDITYGSAPALADLDGNGVPEIIVQSEEGLDVWYGDGRPFPGWPQTFGPYRNLRNSSPVVGDVDGDGLADIALTSTVSGSGVDGEVRLYNRYGQSHPHFPKALPLGYGSVPAIADLDLDGHNELVVDSNYCCGLSDKVWVYDLHGAGPYGQPLWGQFGGGPRHQGSYVSTLPPTATPLPTTTPHAGQFEDVPPPHPFYAYVECMGTQGLISGYPCGGVGEPCVGPINKPYYRPNSSVTRGQVAKIIGSAAGLMEPIPSIQQTFADVAPASTFWLWIERLARRGIVGGYPCGGPFEPCVAPGNRPYFRTNTNVTRGQLSKIAASAASWTETPTGQTFEDSPPGSPFYLYIERMASRGVISGYPCGGSGEPCLAPSNRPYFRPNNPVTRGQTAKIATNTFFPNCQSATPTPTLSPTETPSAMPETMTPVSTATPTGLATATDTPSSVTATATTLRTTRAQP